MSPGHLHIQHVILLREASVMRVILGNTSGTFADVNPETRRPDRPVPPMGGTAAVGAVVHLLVTAQVEKFTLPRPPASWCPATGSVYRPAPPRRCRCRSLLSGSWGSC